MTLSVCACTALALFLIAMASYQAMRTENHGLKRDLGKARADLVTADEAKDRALVNLMLLKAQAKPAKAQAKPADKPKPKKDVPAAPHKKPPVLKAAATTDTKGNEPKKAKPSQEAPQAQPGYTAEATETTMEDGLSVGKLEIWQEGESSSVKFQFSLKNTNSQGTKVRGYTFVALKPEAGGQAAVRISPWTPLKDGRPDMFKRGQYFSIARFKFVRGSFPDLSAINRFQTATVFVYSETGNLVVEKDYVLEEALRL